MGGEALASYSDKNAGGRQNGSTIAPPRIKRAGGAEPAVNLAGWKTQGRPCGLYVVNP